MLNDDYRYNLEIRASQDFVCHNAIKLIKKMEFLHMSFKQHSSRPLSTKIFWLVCFAYTIHLGISVLLQLC